MEKENNIEGIVQRISQSTVWYFFSRDVPINYCRIATKHFAIREDTANAAEVFKILGLDLFKLSQIFVEKPDKFNAATRDKPLVQPTAANYKDLGICRTQDEGAWIAFAKLVSREIRLIHGESDGPLIRIYYPNGEVRRVEWYHRFLHLDGEEIKDIRWYHRWLNKLIDIFSGKNSVFFMRKGKRAKVQL